MDAFLSTRFTLAENVFFALIIFCLKTGDMTSLSFTKPVRRYDFILLYPNWQQMTKMKFVGASSLTSSKF